MRSREQQEAYSDAMTSMAQDLGHLKKGVKAIYSDLTVEDPTFVIHYTNGDRFATTYHGMKSRTAAQQN